METSILADFINLFTWENAIFIGVAFVGMLGHAIKKYLSGQLAGSVVDYLFLKNKKRSILAMLTTLGACLGLILGEQLPTQLGAFLMLAFTTGYTADSSVNKDSE